MHAMLSFAGHDFAALGPAQPGEPARLELAAYLMRTCVAVVGASDCSPVGGAPPATPLK